jgi:peptidoglycan/LPS O-acetylase OafA/YrhL
MLMVVLFHLWPGRVTGGFAGVDVFFVISGFLISGSLIGELRKSSRIKLATFWAKRVRRLLPAALFVIAVTLLASLIFVPPFTRIAFFDEAIASTFYYANWQLVWGSADYFATATPGPFQHYWSLAVEEQFYLVWPLLLLAITWLTAKRFSLRTAAIVVSLVTLSSFGYSLWISFEQPTLAYFSTFVRVWEFGIGALLAMFASRIQLPRLIQAPLSIAGMALIASSALVLSEATVFPGWAALAPTLGTAMVIAAGVRPLPNWLERTYGFKPVAFTGDISYSMYLWHWPLIVLLPFALGQRLSGLQMVAVLAATYLLAYLSKRFIEDRFRALPSLTSRRPRVTFVALATTSIVLLAISTQGSLATTREITAQTTPNNSGQLIKPTLDQAKNDTADEGNACMTEPESAVVRFCKFGVLGADYRVLLVGDSHVAMHLGAWIALAEERNLEITLAYKASCSFNLSVRSETARGQSCAAWNKNLQDELAKTKPFNLALTQYHTGVTVTEVQSANRDKLAIQGFKDAWQPLVERGAKVVAIRDGVFMNKQMRSCWLDAVYDATECEMPRSEAFVEDLAQIAASEQVGATKVDFSDFYCRTSVCPSQIDGIYAFRDAHHISLALSKSMTDEWLLALRDRGIELPAKG